MADFFLTVAGGGPDSLEAIPNALTLKLSKCIRQLSDHEYGSATMYNAKLFIEGSLAKYKEKGGVYNTRMKKTPLQVSAEIIIKETDWKKKSTSEIEKVIKDRIVEAFTEMTDKLKKNNIEVDQEKLLKDLKQYLNKC